MGKHKLLFVCPWAKDRENSWSGTHKGLFNVLNTTYIVEDINSITYSFSYVLKKFINKLGLQKSDMGISSLKCRNKYLNKKLDKYGSDVVFQFEAAPNNSKFRSYVYQDLSAIFVYDIAKNNRDIFKISGFQFHDIKAIKQRALIEKEFYKHVQAIFTMGEWLKKYLIEQVGIPKEKVFSVGGGHSVDINEICTHNKTGNKILFIGRDFYRKGGDLVCKAFKYLIDRGEDLELYVVGPDENFMPEMNKVKGFNFVGRVEKSKVSYYYNLCDIFVMPSRFDAYGLVFIEALTYGLPCIGRDDFEMSYIIKNEENGYLIKDDSVEGLADAIKKCIGNKYIGTNVKRKKQYYIDNYSWKAVGERIRKVIDEKEG